MEGKKVFHVETENIALDFKDGFARTEVLEGAFQEGGIHIYRCVLKAGSSVKTEVEEGTIHTLLLTKGLGAIVTPVKSFAVDEPSVFVPDFGSEYRICAGTDMSYTVFVTDVKEEHSKSHETMGHYALPYFQAVSKGVEYKQDSCKTKNCISRSIIIPTYLQPIIVGAVEFNGDKEGTYEKGHYGVEQWNVVYGEDSRVVIDAEGDKFVHKDGDISYIPGGLDHHLYTEGTSRGKYIFFEYIIPEKTKQNI